MIREVMRNIMVVLVFAKWIDNINGAPQSGDTGGSGNSLLELETFLYKFLSIDPNECLLYVFCKHSTDDTQPVFQQSMAPALRALRFVINNLQSLSELTGLNEHQKLPGLKAFAAAGFMGAATKNATACHEKYPTCPTNLDQLGMYFNRFTSMKEIRQFAEVFIENSEMVTSTRPRGLDYADHGIDLPSVHDFVA